MMEKIGFIGLGLMGREICSAILNNGYEMTVFDTFKASREEFEGRAKVADDPVEVWKQSDIICLCLPSSVEVDLTVNAFIDAGNGKGKTVLDLSSSYPANTRALHERLKAIGANIADAGVMGAPASAALGKLYLLFGGDKELFDTLQPLLNCLSTRCPYLGPSGSGHATKIVMNFMSMATVAVWAEAFPLYEKLGYSMDQLFECTLNTGLESRLFHFYVPKMIHKTYDMAFSLNFATKDMVYCRNMFEEFKAPAFMLDGLIDMLRIGIKDGRGKMDYSTCIATMYDFLGLDNNIH
jgi:3-hydroxyisobutyrate dehydrogenase-like beta-hydroxyacid dehydrogenase